MAERVDELDERQLRIARNEAAFREANEQIRVLNAAGAQLPGIQIVCECGASGCLDLLTVAVGEYEAVRAHGDRFLLKVGHEAEDVESVLERHGGYVVVLKKPGLPAELARSHDPRESTSA